jgi:hypothetical protein
MRMKQAVRAALLSVALHIVVPFIEAKAGPSRSGVMKFDSVFSWPASVCSALVPGGHGIPQLVFPFFFSLAFYAVMFWLLLILYDWLRKRSTLSPSGRVAQV